jgi:hypothetical protein
VGNVQTHVAIVNNDGPCRAHDAAQATAAAFADALWWTTIAWVMATHHGATKVAPGFIIATGYRNEARTMR